MQLAKAIPDKLFFKIGEVGEITGIQAHVLRYWETEFAQLAPQKNRAGQRVYRRRDVEIVLRIRQLLYEEGFTIAGAKKKLAQEMRGGTKLKVVTGDTAPEEIVSEPHEIPPPPPAHPPEFRQMISRIRRDLEQLLTMLNQNDIRGSVHH
ncbi:MAG: MerR family transcriptional regulator [Acidobacteria bacterium]|nr:MerR family transcriptional regulator [Acidobacteriota bacterium]